MRRNHRGGTILLTAPISHQQKAVLNQLINANLQAIAQARDVVTSLSDETYGARVDGRSPAGAHIRHVLDHYLALRDGVAKGVVDYDHRRRDCAVETNRQAALERLQQVEHWLTSMAPESVSLSVKSEVSLCDCQFLTLESDLARELLYTLNHTVHHMAYVALLLKFNGESVADNIGVAPATASYQRARLVS